MDIFEVSQYTYEQTFSNYRRESLCTVRLHIILVM